MFLHEGLICVATGVQGLAVENLPLCDEPPPIWQFLNPKKALRQSKSLGHFGLKDHSRLESHSRQQVPSSQNAEEQGYVPMLRRLSKEQVENQGHSAGLSVSPVHPLPGFFPAPLPILQPALASRFPLLRRPTIEFSVVQRE